MAAEFPSSYVATTSSAVTRNADNLSYDISGTPLSTPQEMTVYGKIIDRGLSYTGTSAAVVHIGADGSSTENHLSLFSPSVTDGGYSLTHDGPTGAGGTASRSGASVDDVVEVRGILHGDGSVSLGLSLNSGAEAFTGPNGSGGLGSDWNSSTIHINKFHDPGFADFIALKIASGVRTMDEMRALADASSDILFQTDFTLSMSEGEFLELDMGDGTIEDEAGNSEVSSMDTGSDFPWHLEPKRGEQQSGDYPLIEVTDGRGGIFYRKRWL